MRLFTGRYDFFVSPSSRRPSSSRRKLAHSAACYSFAFYGGGVTGLLALMYRQLGIKTLTVGPRNLIDFSVRLVLSYLSAKRESVM